MTESTAFTTLCEAPVYAARLGDEPYYVGSMGIAKSAIGKSRGMTLPRCVLPKGHHPFRLRRGGMYTGGPCVQCPEDEEHPIHAPGHMVPQILFEPPESPLHPRDLIVEAAKRLVAACDDRISDKEYDEAWNDLIEKTNALP